MIYARFYFLLFFISVSHVVFSQELLNIGENKKIVAVLDVGTKLTIGYQDVKLSEEGKPFYYVATPETTLGPFQTLLKKELAEFTDEIGSSTTSYLIVSEKGKNYILYKNYKFGPYKSPELLKITENRAVIADFSTNGMYYEVLSLEGTTVKSITKSQKYKDVVTGIYVSDNMDVLMSFDKGSGEASQYFIYQGKRTDGFYHAVHFEGWMKAEKNGFTPVFSCVAPIVDDEYDVTNDLYVGNKLVEKIVAVLYDFSFNSSKTDFVVKGYTASQDGARVFSSNTVLGPYDAVDNLMFDSLDRIQFEYELDSSYFLYANTGSITIAKKEEVEWTNVAPNGIDCVKCVASGDSFNYYFNDTLIASGDVWNIQYLTWTKHYGPILFEQVMQPAEPNPDPNGEEWYGEVVAGYRLNINGDSTKIYESILDFKESSNGEIAYIAYENDGYYVFRGEQKYGPYPSVYTIGKERENFIKWDGDDLIYSAISEGKSHVFQNGEPVLTYPGIMSFYWNQSLESSAIVMIKDPKCFIESDFYSKPLDAEPFMEELEAQFHAEFEERRAELLTLNDCSAIYFMGIEFPGLTFVNELEFSPDGKYISFKNMDDLNLIYKNELLNGTIYNNKVIYYYNGNVVVKDL